ncbi:MAG TPA: class I SAM-dependent methyltransferase [Drouetiella sp.]|jgi:ubiquinone/menaquinone biosynthesis C-methylase UbiE
MTVEILQTLKFLAPFSDSGVLTPASLLEVGCGEGDLAVALGEKLRVVAIERNQSAALSAMQKCVNVIQMDFFDFPENEDKFDIVLFARSLHHIQPLEEAICKTAKLLKPDGRMIIEDFAAEKADLATVNWYFRARRELNGVGLLSSHSRFHAVDSAPNALTWWRQHHFEKHQVATSTEMRQAIAAHFTIEEESFVPYMYRYLLTDLLPGVDGTEVEWAIFEDEDRLCAEGQIIPIGYRLVAAKK